jgi:hypothetical protein
MDLSGDQKRASALEGLDALALVRSVPRVSRGGVQAAPLCGDKCLASVHRCGGAHSAGAVNVRGELGAGHGFASWRRLVLSMLAT